MKWVSKIALCGLLVSLLYDQAFSDAPSNPPYVYSTYGATLKGVEKNPTYSIDRTPQLPIEVYAEAFAKIVGPKPQLVHLAEGFGFTEGPAYVSIQGSQEGYLLFTDQINDNILMLRWYGLAPYQFITPLSWSKPVIFRHPSNIADGQTIDLQGRLLTAETTGRRVSITELNGEVKTLAGFYEGKPLNSPNDLVVKSDGTVWFTDPGYGCLQFPQEGYLPNNVYRLDPKTNELTVVVKGLKMPNGIAFSPDEKILYLIDSGACQAPRTYYEKYPHAIYAFDVSENGKRLDNQRLFTVVSPGFPDGMRLDSEGNLYVGALDGVQVFNPQGKLIGKILLPKETANLTFGGKENNVLFICSSDSIWALKLNAKGAVPIREIETPSSPLQAELRPGESVQGAQPTTRDGLELLPRGRLPQMDTSQPTKN